LITNVYDVRVILLSGNGSSFSSGLDLKSKLSLRLLEMKNNTDIDTARIAYNLYYGIRKFQENLTSIEKCHLPVIAIVHGYCLGGAMSLLSCVDIRISTKSANYSIREVEIGITADVGLLQRITKQIGKEGIVKKLAFTAETFNGEYAYKYGLVDELVENEEELFKRGKELCAAIAEKSPVALWGIKRTINFCRDNSVETSLDMVATLNSALLQSDDLPEAIKGVLTKTKPKFPKL
jgi:enoyl-CoA hydratase/carnithine racemase